MVSVEVVTVLAGENGSSRAKLDIRISHFRSSSSSNDSVRGLSGDHVSDVADALVVQVQITKVALTGVDQDAQQLQDGLVALAFSESAHRRLYQVELLLEIIEADLGIESVPVEHLVFDESGRAQFAVNLFVVQDVEHLLEKGCTRRHK